MKLSKRDIILIVLAITIGGAGSAATILKLANRYLERYFAKFGYSSLDKQYFRNVLTRLKRDGLIESERKGFWKFTKRGREKAELLHKYHKYEEFKNKSRNKQPDTIITFDVPELNRKKRDYLRLELLALGYIPIQKSVLLGHSPLPKEFLDYINESRLAGYMQIFTIKKFGTLRD